MRGASRVRHSRTLTGVAKKRSQSVKARDNEIRILRALRLQYERDSSQDAESGFRQAADFA
jgi:uncharacterized membrane protein